MSAIFDHRNNQKVKVHPKSKTLPFPKTRNEELKEAISYVCADCGDLYLTPEQRYKERISTWHTGKCGLCGEITAVNHIRNFNWLRR